MSLKTRTARALGTLVPFVVWCVSLARGATGAQWRTDMASLRDLNLAGVGCGGSLSSALTQLFGLLPLGSLAERAAAASAFAVALASSILFRLGFRAVSAMLVARRDELSSGQERLAGALAGVAALASALGPSWQAEATVGGGAAVSLALSLFVLGTLVDLLCDGASLSPEGSRRWLMMAGGLGLTLAESPPTAALVFVVACAMLATADRSPPVKLRLPMLGAVAGAAAIMALPVLLRPFAPSSLDDLARLLSSAGLRAVPRVSGRDAVMSWVEQLGYSQLALAALGLSIGAARERQRVLVMMVLATPIVELLAPSNHWIDGSPTPLSPLSIASFLIGATLGVAEIVVFLGSLELALARLAGVLAVVFHMTLAALTCEEASFSSDRTARLAAETWTEQALERLPRDAAIVVRSPDLAWRLWAAQSVNARRPDVLVVAAPLFVRRAGLTSLLPRGPEVAPIVRDLALTGSASEFGLSVLADARPLRVELDASWDPRMLQHVVLDGPWLRFDAAALGVSDRPADGKSALVSEAKIAEHVRAGARRDAVSAAVLGRTLKEQATAMSLVGQAAATPPLLDELDRLLPGDPFVVSARLRVQNAVRQTPGAAVELRDLLRF